MFRKIDRAADYYGKLDDVQNEVWVVTHQSVLNAVHQGMLCRRVFIADGHHRYGTALLYRQWLQQQRGAKLPADHPANFLACMFVSMSEPGLLVLPTHRTILGVKQVKLDKIAAALDEKFHLRWHKLQEVADPQALLEQSDPMAFGLASGGEDRLLVAWPKQVDALLVDLADKYSEVWRALQVAIVHNYVLDRVIFKHSGVSKDQIRIEYTHACEPALDAADNCDDALVVLLQPVSMEAVRQVSLAGDLMPQKSTYFFPKIATGLVIYPLA